jgi:hypothetical protein
MSTNWPRPLNRVQFVGKSEVGPFFGSVCAKSRFNTETTLKLALSQCGGVADNTRSSRYPPHLYGGEYGAGRDALGSSQVIEPLHHDAINGPAVHEALLDRLVHWLCTADERYAWRLLASLPVACLLFYGLTFALARLGSVQNLADAARRLRSHWAVRVAGMA